MARVFSEDSRVKIPALLHFTRLGYRYRRLKDIRAQLDFETNIDRQMLREAMNRLNPSLLAEPLTDEEFQVILAELTDSLAGDDLGQAFFGRLVFCLQERLDEKNHDRAAIPRRKSSGRKRRA